LEVLAQPHGPEACSAVAQVFNPYDPPSVVEGVDDRRRDLCLGSPAEGTNPNVTDGDDAIPAS